MSDKFYPTRVEHLFYFILNDFSSKGEIFNIPEKLFYNAEANRHLFSKKFGQQLHNPIGLAAGPHTQLAQNIVSGWLCGARFIELKTIQTLDELDVSKPCIDMQDEGYNCEWSQELKIRDSFNEYLNAWLLIHLLNHKLYRNLSFPGSTIGTIFNMSIGYNMEGIKNENVQWFLKKMNDCIREKNEKIKILKNLYPEIEDIEIPDKISNNVTLSTMHGCPPEEIEKIGKYLLEEKGLHTTIKLNPTLLGPVLLRKILNRKLGFKTFVPDEAFDHDLKYPDAIEIIKSLKNTAEKLNLNFGIKLSNTLECINQKNILPKNEKMIYMSGKALHPVTVNLAKKIQEEFSGAIDISFSGGADCFNITNLLACGFSPVTVCSDLLKPGGYVRLHQYFDIIMEQFLSSGANSIGAFILAKSTNKTLAQKSLEILKKCSSEVLENKKYHKDKFIEPNIKTDRELSFFDCIAAPCAHTCPTHQDIPGYLRSTASGDFGKAFDIILKTNPFPSVTGMVCDQKCRLKCTRINYDSPLLIREIKRFVSEQAGEKFTIKKSISEKQAKVAIIGAGPSGLSCAWFLGLAGFEVQIFETKAAPGGMVSDAIPLFRISEEAIQKDIERIKKSGVKIKYNNKIDAEILEKLRKQFDFIYIATGAPLTEKLKITGIETTGVLDPLTFLFEAKKNKKTGIGKNIAVIGGGNTAMDAARTALRLAGKNGNVTIIYRRTMKEMPAGHEEIKAALDEEIKILELTNPKEVLSENGKVRGLFCVKTKLSSEKDKSGRPTPVEIPGSEFHLGFDTIIPALGQKAALDFIDKNKLENTTSKYQTENIFIGGDALRGASTVINAIADGRKVAEEIIKKSGIKPEGEEKRDFPEISIDELKIKKTRRILPFKTEFIQEKNLSNFKQPNVSLSKDEAITESSRCLSCDLLCDVCVSVCPNHANFSYEVQPVKFQLQEATQKNGNVTIKPGKQFKISQSHQVLNISDWCNECGNCAVFCPTSGASYKDKPKFHLSAESFRQSEEGFFFSKTKNKKTLIHKSNNNFSSLCFNNEKYIFENENFKAVLCLDNSFFKIEEIKFFEVTDKTATFKEATEMWVIMNAVKNITW